jgi:ribosomal protein L40E
VLCSRCSATLPDGSQFCLKCGQKVDSAASSVALATISVQTVCKECRTSLPPSSDFCLKCGQPVISTTNRPGLAPALPSGLETPQPPARSRHLIAPWLLVLLLLGALLWVATSETPAAQQVQEFVGWSKTETIVDAAFSVKPHSFSAYEFTVPRGALSISVAGEFSESPATAGMGAKSKNAKDHDTNIEAYVLTDAAFAVWRGGYSTQTQYESGPAASATINASLPAGAGVYHLVFSNKSSPHGKDVHATVFLRYKNRWPDAIGHLKDQFWSWIGLACVYL